MSVDLTATFKAFVGTNTLTTKVLLDAASHLVEALKDSGLSDMEKNQLVFSTLFKHVQTAEMTSTVKSFCLPLSFLWSPFSTLLCKKVDAITPSAPVVEEQEPTEVPVKDLVVTVREPEPEKK